MPSLGTKRAAAHPSSGGQDHQWCQRKSRRAVKVLMTAQLQTQHSMEMLGVCTNPGSQRSTTLMSLGFFCFILLSHLTDATLLTKISPQAQVAVSGV